MDAKQRDPFRVAATIFRSGDGLCEDAGRFAGLTRGQQLLAYLADIEAKQTIARPLATLQALFCHHPRWHPARRWAWRRQVAIAQGLRHGPARGKQEEHSWPAP